jgi:UDP-N-acetylglucosamine 2-epimerase (non-hydrolysing)
MRILAVVGARPNFIKIAPLLWEIKRRPSINAFLVHTGQHFDERMSKLFFEELRIPRPNINLGVHSDSHAVQTAEVMKRFEPVLLEQKPDVVLVVGDVNSTLACALTSVKLGVPVAHVEAGLRSFDRTMPEEINRLLTDAISEWLFVTERSGLKHLHAEGIPNQRVHFVGNVMIDTLLACRERSECSSILEQLGVASGKYAVATLHRPPSVDDENVLQGLLSALDEIRREIPIVFPVHPRTRKMLDRIPSAGGAGLTLTEPLVYLDFLKLVAHARVVLTDSGGIQEETTVLGVPCLTLRTSTERPVTIEHGTNMLAGLEATKIVTVARTVLHTPPRPRQLPELWDGRAAGRILDILTMDCQQTETWEVRAFKKSREAECRAASCSS